MFKSLEEIKTNVEQIKLEMKSKDLDPANFCVVPFTTIILEPDGQVGVCRHKGHNFPIGNIKEKSINEIWNDHFVSQWRREFLEGNSLVCKTELRHRQCQLCPENNKLLSYAELAVKQTQPILKLTANFNGKCNLQCQMCDVWKLPNGLYDQINFWEPAKESIFPYLKEIDMLSGEPFIQTDTFRLIDEVSSVNSECQWTFTTNAHWKFNSRMEKSLDKIKIKTMIVSVDSIVAETYQKIRFPGKLSQVLETIDCLIDYQGRRNPFNIFVNFLVQKDNAYECLEMIKFCYDKKINPLLTFLYEPDKFSLLSLGTTEKLKILEFYFSKADSALMGHLKKVLFPLIESLPSIERVFYMQQFHELMVKTKNG